MKTLPNKALVADEAIPQLPMGKTRKPSRKRTTFTLDSGLVNSVESVSKRLGVSGGVLIDLFHGMVVQEGQLTSKANALKEEKTKALGEKVRQNYTLNAPTIEALNQASVGIKRDALVEIVLRGIIQIFEEAEANQRAKAEQLLKVIKEYGSKAEDACADLESKLAEIAPEDDPFWNRVECPKWGIDGYTTYWRATFDLILDELADGIYDAYLKDVKKDQTTQGVSIVDKES